jgi:hypothetical protein
MRIFQNKILEPREVFLCKEEIDQFLATRLNVVLFYLVVLSSKSGHFLFCFSGV